MIQRNKEESLEMGRRALAGEQATALAKEYGSHVSKVYFWKNIVKGEKKTPKKTTPTKRRTHYMDIPLETTNAPTDNAKVAVIVTTATGLKEVLAGLWK